MPPKGNRGRKPTYRPEQSYATFMEAFRRPIPTWHLLRQYENRFVALENRFTPQQVFDIMNQFSRHEAHLTQVTGIGPRPTNAEIEQQHSQFMTQRSKRRTRRMEEPDEAPFDAAEGAGYIPRKRTASEAELMTRETLDFGEDDEDDDVFEFNFWPPNQSNQDPPPPPPPSGGAIFI
ncbi:hypothetical protein EBT25_05000 [bacterium]|jgi:hypothetical protein|nr:hypothetical protein [bacterium]